METRFERNDLRLLAACALVAAASLAAGVPLFYRAFPEASIDFATTRDQSQQTALAFLEEAGHDAAPYRHSAVFAYDETAKTFLERELGLEGARRAIGDPVRLWRWSHRWVQPSQKEEFRVALTTAGELVSFSHIVEESRPGARLDAAAARALAQRLATETLGRDLGRYAFVEAEQIERPARTDHLFTWKLKGFAVGEATYRFRLRLLGDRLGGFDEYLKVPEQWQRQYQDLRSYNEATGLVASIFMFLTWAAMLVWLAINLKRQRVRWGGALAFGAVAAGLTFLAQLNQLPVAAHGFDTSDTFAGFIAQQVLLAGLAGLAAGLGIAVLAAGTEPVYREDFPDQVGLFELFTRRGLGTRRFVLHACIGLALTAFFFAYQTLFYTVADRLGAWSPADIPYREMVNTYFPWITVLLIGFMPAVSEEFTSRAFSIPLFNRLLRSKTAAVLVAAVIWGFAHAGYPQQPFYIRGIEVTLAGILIGYVVLRWGLLPALVWHYTIDALYTGLILLRSSNPYFVVSASLSIGLVLLPLAVALFAYARRRCWTDPTPLLNRNIAGPPAPDAGTVPFPERRLVPEARLAETAPSAYRPLSRRALAVAAVLCACGAGLWLTEPQRPLENVDFAYTRHQAQRLAAEHLTAAGIDLAAYRSVVWQQQQTAGLTYLAHHGGIAAVNRLYAGDLRAALWIVRFFRPQQKEEYRVAINPADGAVYSVTHLLDENAPGADLADEDARRIAADHLRRYGLDPASLEVVEASSEKLPARRDHRLVFQAQTGDRRNVAEALYRVEVRLAGDRPVALKRWLKLPEDWLRQRNATDGFRMLLRGLQILLVAAVGLHLLWLLVRRLRRARLDWTWPIRLSVLCAAMLLIGLVNQAATFYSQYPTQTAPAVFAVTQGSVWVISLVGLGLAVLASLALLIMLYPEPWQRLLDPWPRRQVFDAVLAAVLGLLGLAAVQRAVLLLQDLYAAHLVGVSYEPVVHLDSYLPAWGGLQGAALNALFLPLAVGLAAFYLYRILRRPLIQLGAGLALAALFAAAPAHTAGEFALGLALNLWWLSAFFLMARYLLRDNLPAYMLLGLGSGVETAIGFGAQTAPAYLVQAVVLLVCCLALAAAVLYAKTAKAP